MTRGARVAIVCFIVVSATVLLWRGLERANRLSHVPAALHVSKVLYASEESWGFGPGGNETGVIAYELPAEVAEQVARGRESFLNEMDSRAPPSVPSDRGWYAAWKETPVTGPRAWFTGGLERSRIDPGKMPPRLESYLDQYGFWIPVEPAVRDAIDQAIGSPGSFYANGRLGVLVVDPSHRRVYFVYAG